MPAIEMADVLVFASANAAFDYASKYLARPLVHRAHLVGYVDGPAERAPHDSSRDPRGKFVASLATHDGIFQAQFCGSIAAEVSGRGPERGDLVPVCTASYGPEKQEPLNYFIIAAILLPRLSLRSGCSKSGQAHPTLQRA